MSGKDDGRYDLLPFTRRARDAVKKVRTSYRTRFILSFLSSVVVLVLVIFMITGGYAQVIATFASVGGISAEIGEIRGDNVQIYPSVGESSNCPWQTPGTSSGPQDDEGRYQNPVSPSDQALPQLRADISDATVPAGYGVKFTKDVELPGPFSSDAFRISIKRNESLVPEPIDLASTSYDQPAATTATDQFIRGVTVEPNNATVGAEVVPLQEVTGFDRSSGRRDITQARIYLVQGESYNFEVEMDTVKSPFSFEEDRAPNYVQQTAAAAVGLDWDNSEFTSTFDESYDVGSGDGGTDGIETVNTDITVPTTDVTTGSTLMRVMMNVSSTDTSDYIRSDPNRGTVEEYTVVIVESLDDVPSPVEIGDASLKTSGLQADLLDLRGGTLGSELALNDKYSTAGSGSTTNPVFAADPPPQGEFSLEATGSGQNAKIRNASARLHQLAFTSLDISLVELDLEYINSSEANIATQQCPILEPSFLPRITNAPFNVSPSDSFTVDYAIRNPGLDSETQTVDVEYPNGSVQNSFTDTISATSEKSYTDTLTAPPTTGRYDVVIDPQDEPPAKSAVQEVIVGEPPNFQVNIDAISPDPVVAEDETLEVQTTVTNTGDVVGEQDIVLRVGGQVKDFNTQNLTSGASNTFNFSYTPTDSDAGASVPVNVSSRDDFDVQNVEIKESPQFEVNITGSNAPVDSSNNEVLTVFANVTNTGGAQDTQDIILDIRNSQGTNTDVDNVTGLTLNPGQSTASDLQLNYTTSDPEDPPEVEATASSDDDLDSESFPINGSGVIFQVDDVTPRPDSVDPDDQIEFDTQVTNVGPENGSQDVELNITRPGGTVVPNVNSTSLFLNSGETANVSLFYTAKDEDAPEIQGEALTRNQTTGEKVDSDTANVTVSEPAFFDPTIVGAENEPIEGSEELEVAVDITNTGGLVGDGTVTLEVDTNQDGTYDTVADVQAIEGLGVGSTTRRYLNYATETGDADAVDVRVRGYTTRREAEDFDDGGSVPAGWTTSGDASITTSTSNSGSYSAEVSSGSTSNTLESPTVDTTFYEDSGVIALDYWVRKGGSFSDLPESGEDLVVEYKDDTGTWQTVETIQSNSFADGEKIANVDTTITSADAFHTGFQVRFRGDGDGTDGFDYWHVDDVAIKSGDIDGTDTVDGLGVLTPPFYAVSVTGVTDTSFEVGTGGVSANPTVTADITNTGTADGGQQIIELDVDGDGNPEDTQAVTLAAGDTTTVSLTWSPNTCEDATTCSTLFNDGTPTVSSDNDSDTGASITAQRPNFDVVSVDSRDDGSSNTFGNNGIVDASSEDHLLDYSVQNTGSVTDSREVTWDVGGGGNYAFQNDIDTVTFNGVASGNTVASGTRSFTPNCGDADNRDGADQVSVDFDLDFQGDGVPFNEYTGSQDYNMDEDTGTFDSGVC